MARARWVGWLMGSGLVALCCAVGSACGDGDDSEGCLLQPEQGKAEAAGTLVYAVSGSAIAQVFKVVYATPAGEKTVDNPTLPFSVSLEVPAGASMHLEVTGSASPGASIMAGYSLRTADASAGAAVSATCQH